MSAAHRLQVPTGSSSQNPPRKRPVPHGYQQHCAGEQLMVMGRARDQPLVAPSYQSLFIDPQTKAQAGAHRAGEEWGGAGNWAAPSRGQKEPLASPLVLSLSPTREVKGPMSTHEHPPFFIRILI